MLLWKFQYLKKVRLPVFIQMAGALFNSNGRPEIIKITAPRPYASVLQFTFAKPAAGKQWQRWLDFRIVDEHVFDNLDQRSIRNGFIP